MTESISLPGAMFALLRYSYLPIINDFLMKGYIEVEHIEDDVVIHRLRDDINPAWKSLASEANYLSKFSPMGRISADILEKMVKNEAMGRHAYRDCWLHPENLRRHK
ncbi:hypothetical protein [uncultured Sphingomonas sp.]|uniref:hypothetical protein n=1 Tax=uncultured Sphingomonas sp. TaxID=158754 RepID=UPI0025EDEC5E|nr:hypothetical protein [uncultured Sphingomonas sp.]